VVVVCPIDSLVAVIFAVVMKFAEFVLEFDHDRQQQERIFWPNKFSLVILSRPLEVAAATGTEIEANCVIPNPPLAAPLTCERPC